MRLTLRTLVMGSALAGVEGYALLVIIHIRTSL